MKNRFSFFKEIAAIILMAASVLSYGQKVSVFHDILSTQTVFQENTVSVGSFDELDQRVRIAYKETDSIFYRLDPDTDIQMVDNVAQGYINRLNDLLLLDSMCLVNAECDKWERMLYVNQMTDFFNYKLPTLKTMYVNNGILSFEKQEMQPAFDYFLKAIYLNRLRGVIDTSNIGYVAIAAEKTNNKNIAKKLYSALLMTDFDDGNREYMYTTLVQMYLGEEDQENAQYFIKKGLQHYPNNKYLIAEDFRLALSKGTNTELPLFDDPTNELEVIKEQDKQQLIIDPAQDQGKEVIREAIDESPDTKIISPEVIEDAIKEVPPLPENETPTNMDVPEVDDIQEGIESTPDVNIESEDGLLSPKR